ncbi:MAG: Fic family protein [bacterium]
MNYFGITDPREIDLLEDQAYVQTVTDVIHYITRDQSITLSLILRIHESMFGRLYPWAGKYRTVNVSKGQFSWPPWVNIEPSMKEYAEKVLESCTPAWQHPDEVFERAAMVMGDLLAIHPFREGNGRVANLLGNILFLQVNFPMLDLRKLKKADLIQAALSAYGKDYDPFITLLQSSMPGVE